MYRHECTHTHTHRAAEEGGCLSPGETEVDVSLVQSGLPCKIVLPL